METAMLVTALKVLAEIPGEGAKPLQDFRQFSSNGPLDIVTEDLCAVSNILSPSDHKKLATECYFSANTDNIINLLFICR